MSGSSEEPPATMEAGPPEELTDLKESCEQGKNQLESVKDIMLKNKQTLRKKEEELQEYAKKLSKFKTRKASRSNKDDAKSSNESTPKSKSDTKSIVESSENIDDDISQAKTPKAKSSLLQKKLAEDRKIFEQRSKEITQNKRAVEEKVEALRQQLEEKYVTPVSVVSPVLVPTQANHHVMQFSQVQDKDNKISELNRKIFELEADIIDLQDNLKEKDSVIDAKTKAVTLMSADLSRKGKTTLDTLEDTKDEMRSMQENFVLLESSLRNKNDNLIKQLEERNEHILKLEQTIDSLTHNLQTQKETEAVNADFSKSTMDTLVETKDAMKSMQENFVLVETSLKSKNDHLLKQLEERELKLAEAEAKILNFESGLGIQRQPNVDNLIYKVEKLEEVNRILQDEKFELQKSIAELQDRFISSDKLLMERDDEIAELKNLKDELKKCNEILELDKTAYLQQVNNLNERNEAMKSEITNFEKQVQKLVSDNAELTEKLTVSECDVSKDNDKVQKLTKELEELNKTMIKLKAQHKNKLKNVQKQLENFRKMSDTNAELIKLGNQVALLEEEKGNLQLSLVDFDELKASAGDWQKRILDLEGKVSAQAKEIQAHIEAIAILENQKLDIMQEQHSLKQEISSLEAENAESENLRVRAEMKLVDLEEELESLHKARAEAATDAEPLELQPQSEPLGEAEAKEEAVEADRAELLRKIDGLTRENAALLERLARFEEKGSSDTGSTESFERIPEHGLPEAEASVRLESLTRENYELVVKLTKLEERMGSSEEAEARLQRLARENERLLGELAQHRGAEGCPGLPPATPGEPGEFASSADQQESSSPRELERQKDEEPQKEKLRAGAEAEALASLEAELERYSGLLGEQSAVAQELRLKLADAEEELAGKAALMERCAEASALEGDSLRRELAESANRLAEWRDKCAELEAALDSVERGRRGAEEEHERTLAGLQSGLEEQRGLVASREQLVQELRSSLAGREEELQATQLELANCSRKVDLLQGEVNELQALLEQREAGAASTAEELETWRRNSSALAEELQAARQQLTYLGEELERRKSPEEYQELSDRMRLQETQLAELERELEAERGLAEEGKSKLAELLADKRKRDETLQELERTRLQLESQLQELGAAHEQSTRSATDAMRELQEAYRQLEQLKVKHTEDMEMANGRLENLLEELEGKVQEAASMQSELEEKDKRLGSSISEEVKAALEERLAELQNKLAEAEERAQLQLDKMKRYAAVAKKKSSQCEELEAKLAKLEEKLAAESAESEATSNQKDNRISELEEELRLLLIGREEALRNVDAVKLELARAREEWDSREKEFRELSEAKDRARELGVRMEVMETEYMDQLALINSLKTENGLLLSKQAQISERLENAEKEAEERLRALEGKLQEREAELARLNTELHNFSGELAQKSAVAHSYKELKAAHEDLKVAHEELKAAHEELMAGHEELKAAHEQLKAQQEAALRDGEELSERAAQLEAANAKVHESLEATERQLSEAKALSLAQENLGAQCNQQYSQLLEEFEKQRAELESARSRLEEALLLSEKREAEMHERMQLLDQTSAAVSGQNEQSGQSAETLVSQDTEAPGVTERHLAESLPLFDASVFSQASGNEQVQAAAGRAEFFGEELQTLQALLAQREEEVSRLRAELSSLKEAGAKLDEITRELEEARSENGELKDVQTAYKLRLAELEREARTNSESAVIAELENRIGRILSERDILQLQMNEATRAFEELRESQDTVKRLRAQLQTVAPEKEEPALPAADLLWENEEDLWTYGDKTIQDIPVVPSAEIQLKLKLEEIEELEKQLSQMADEKAKLLEESKLAQVKNVKYARKLKEYKLQLDDLRQRVQPQKSLDSFGELDSAIEEELKGQIDALEKALAELREEKRKLVVEKEGQARRIEALTAASERVAEAKEKQDSELRIWQMRHKELELQLQKLDFGPETREAASSPARSIEAGPEKPSSQLELKELRENVEALAAENEELQQLLEEQRSTRQAPHDEARLRELEPRLLELQSTNEKLKLDYENLRRQYEQTIMDADAETRSLRQNRELLAKEWADREAAAARTLEELTEKLEATLTEKAETEAALAERLQEVTHLKAQLEAQLKAQLEAQVETRSQLGESSSEGARDASLPVFTFETDVNEQELQALRIQLEEKNREIEQLQRSLNDNSLTHMVQQLQDSVNLLYNEKDSLEKELGEKSAHINSLIKQIESSRREEEEDREDRSHSAAGEQEEILKIQHELHEREQQLAQLKYALEEKEVQLKVALEEANSDGEARASAEKLRSELYESQAELETLKFTVSELQSEIAALRGLQRLADEDRITIEKLASEKEEVRREAQESLRMILEEREAEMRVLMEELATEKRNLIETLGLRERDIENLRIQVEQKALHHETVLAEKEQLLEKLEDELSERDRRLAELSVTKDSEIHNLRIQLSEKAARIEELSRLSEEEGRQLGEIRTLLEVKEQQINGLSQQLEEKSKEFELIQRALQRHMPSEYSTEMQQQVQEDLSGPAMTFDSSESSVAKELDVALYMLHQRDVRCEELTLELMQLLEERDTLQLRLSNAIRVNEELRNLSSHQIEAIVTEPLLADPSPSKSEGPVEITKEPAKLSIDQDNKALAQKLSQLRSVSHGKDVRLRDEREMRHSQQMSLLSHKDVLSSLPPEAAARLMDANYTVSRDVQSQSSVLMNWLWGKSTPKVVHM